VQSAGAAARRIGLGRIVRPPLALQQRRERSAGPRVTRRGGARQHLRLMRMQQAVKASVLTGHVAIEPPPETRHGRERGEAGELRQLVLEDLHHLLDEKLPKEMPRSPSWQFEIE
jgi:hypothetical protein